MRRKPEPRKFRAVWKSAWSRPGFRLQFALTLVAFFLILTLLSSFLNFVETRNGVMLRDPVLLLFPRADLTWITFGLIYLGLAAGIANLSRFPDHLTIALQSYVLTTVTRMAAMYVVPLNPPPEMIPLHDPFVEILGTGRLLTKDLFFSGHTSTMVLLSFTAPQRGAKYIFGLCAVLVGSFVLVQRVHYSVDVLAAPFFTYVAYRVVILTHRGTCGPGELH